MCKRMICDLSKDELEDQCPRVWGKKCRVERYDNDPSKKGFKKKGDHTPVIVSRRHFNSSSIDEGLIVPMKWGLKRGNTFNCRKNPNKEVAETFKPLWDNNNRCAVIMEKFFQGKEKEHTFQSKTKRPLTVAGLYDSNDSSYTMLTVPSCSFVKQYHRNIKSMPAMLANEDEVKEWLESSTLPQHCEDFKKHCNGCLTVTPTKNKDKTKTTATRHAGDITKYTRKIDASTSSQ